MDLTLSAVSWMSQAFPGKTDEEYRRHLGSFGITGSLGLQRCNYYQGSKVESGFCGFVFKPATYISFG